MTSLQKSATLAGRLALAAIFVHSGFGKLAGLEGAAGYIASQGLPAPILLAFLAGAVELGAGLGLAAGLRTRWAALALAAFLIPATVLFHNPSGLPGAQAAMQEIQIYKNLAIFGGLLSVAAWGAGALSLDAALSVRRSRTAPKVLRRAA